MPSLLIRVARALGGWARRLWWLVRRGARDPVRERPPAGRPARAIRPLVYALVLLAVALCLVVAGPAVHLLRLAGAGLASGALSHVGRLELWTVAIAPIAVCSVVTGVVLVLARLVSAEAWPRRPLRRLLNGLFVGALLFLLLHQDFTRSRQRELGAGLVLAVVFFHHLVDRGLGRHGAKAVLKGTLRAVAATFERVSIARGVCRALPWGALLVAVAVSAFSSAGLDRALLIAPSLVLAAVAFTAPCGVAGAATGRADDALRTPRTALAAAGLLCIVVVIFAEETALLATTIAGGLLVMLCTVVAGRTANRFAPFAAALGISIFTFAGIATALDNARSPKISPVAFVTTDGTLVCGAYVGQRDDQLTYARLIPAARPKLFAAAAATAGPETIPLSRVDEPIARDRLLPVSRAMRRAAQLGNELAAVRTPDTASAAPAPGDRCPRPPRRAEGRKRPMHELAKRFQPAFRLAEDEMFWPVSVDTVFGLEGRDGSVCLRARAAHRRCDRLASAYDLPWRGHREDVIDFPERLARHELRDRVGDVLDDRGPAETATVYFLGSGPRAGRRTTSIQYWAYYAYNYVLQKVAGIRLFETGAHLSDFEYVGLVLSASGRPRYAFMSRHTAREGRAFLWGDEGLEHLDDDVRGEGEDHLSVAVAEGSHANYERCGHQPRDGEGALGVIGINRPFDDDADCGGATIGPATPLVDVASVPWACWPGRFGRGRVGLVEELLPGAITERAPQGPLQQQRFDGRSAAPCRGVADPRDRRVDTEERLPATVAATLSSRAGRIESWVDDCGDWSKPPFTGAILVACDQKALRAYFASGLDRVPPRSLRVSRTGGGDRAPSAAIPAVARDRDSPDALRRWRIEGTGSSIGVYAARRRGRALRSAHFTGVPSKRGQRLRVIEASAREWRLVDDEMRVVSRACGRRALRSEDCGG